MMQGKSVDTRAFAHLYPFRSRYLVLGGLRYHYLDEGRGDPVVMVHGNPTWSFYFRNLVTALRPDYRAVVPDHMGCGLSDKPGDGAYDFRLESRVRDLSALLDHLGLRRDLTFVLHDWGGMIGMAYAAAHPDRVRRLVILNTAAFRLPAGKRLPLPLRLVRDLPWIGGPAVLGFNAFARGALVMAASRRLSREVRAGLTAPYNRPKHRLATLRFVQDIPLSPGDPSYGLVRRTEQRLGRLAHLPMLICWGGRDFVFDLDFLDQWRQRFPLARIHVFPKAGHYVLEDEPDAVVGLVKTFLRTHAI